jgi:D-alanyl-D-alanine carboxypeptidase
MGRLQAVSSGRPNLRGVAPLRRRPPISLLLLVAVATSFTLGVGSGSGASPKTAAQANSQLVSALRSDLATYLKTRGAKEHLSSLSLAVSYRADQPTITVTSGTTTYGGRTPVTPTSLYQIGSNTKAFTAVAILQLEAKGKLSIDAPIGKYLPQYPAYAKLTLRQLLRMTSGLESYDNLPAWETAYASDPMANVPADALIRTIYPQIKFRPPGSKYHYSNTGYLIAQEVVSARSDSKSFSAEIARIASSVGLTRTFYTSHLYAPQIARDVVAGYYEQADKGLQPLRGKDVSGDSLSWAQGAGSMVSTPADLVTWARALYTSTTLLPAKQRAEMMALISTKTAKPLAKPTADDPSGFGLGVAERYNSQMGTFWFYQGETLGFRAAHIYFPNSGLAVAIFANSRPVESESHIAQLFVQLYATIKKYAPKRT